METIKIATKKGSEFIDITAKVKTIVHEKRIKKGFCCVFCPHTTAALTINENADPAVTGDIINHLDKLVPKNGKFSHSEGNSDAHIKSSLLESSLNIFIEDYKLALGTWQGIYFCEFDGPRNRKIYLDVIER